MDRRLQEHLRRCAGAFATRAQDRELTAQVLGAARAWNLHLGVDKAMFGPHRRDVEGMRRDYAIPQGRRVALFVGRVDVGKNVSTLIDAAAQAIAEGVPLHLVIAGVGPSAAEASRRLEGHVSLPGFVKPEELARLYASVDFLALPSEVETGSMATTEAIASGCPALVAEGSGSLAIYDETPAMHAVGSGVEAWTAALRELVHDRDKLAAMRAAALDYGASASGELARHFQRGFAPRVARGAWDWLAACSVGASSFLSPIPMMKSSPARRRSAGRKQPAPWFSRFT